MNGPRRPERMVLVKQPATAVMLSRGYVSAGLRWVRLRAEGGWGKRRRMDRLLLTTCDPDRAFALHRHHAVFPPVHLDDLSVRSDGAAEVGRAVEAHE